MCIRPSIEGLVSRNSQCKLPRPMIYTVLHDLCKHPFSSESVKCGRFKSTEANISILVWAGSCPSNPKGTWGFVLHRRLTTLGQCVTGRSYGVSNMTLPYVVRLVSPLLTARILEQGDHHPFPPSWQCANLPHTVQGLGTFFTLFWNIELWGGLHAYQMLPIDKQNVNPKFIPGLRYIMNKRSPQR